MSTEEHSRDTRKREPWRPTKEFWTLDSRSARLREVNLDIANRVLDLLHDPEVIQDIDRQHELYTELEALNGELIELGIVPDIQTCLPVEVYYRDPIIAAEWIAGQLIQFTGRKVVSELDAQPLMGEFGEHFSGAVGVLDDPLPAKLASYYDTSMIVGNMRTLLDPTDEELSDFWRSLKSL